LLHPAFLHEKIVSVINYQQLDLLRQPGKECPHIDHFAKKNFWYLFIKYRIIVITHDFFIRLEHHTVSKKVKSPLLGSKFHHKYKEATSIRQSPKELKIALCKSSKYRPQVLQWLKHLLPRLGYSINHNLCFFY
jgi:hypothetical protein